MSETLEAQTEIRALKAELALLRGEASATPTTILEGPAEVIRLAAKPEPKAPEDALLPELGRDLSLDDGLVVQRMIELIAESPFGVDSEGYARGRELAMALLALRLGSAKLLWTRREVHEVFRRSGQLLEREVRRGIEGGKLG